MVEFENTSGADSGTQESCLSEYMRPLQAADYCGISLSKLAKLRMRDNRVFGPSYIKLCGNVLYRRSEIDDWLNNHRVVA